MKRITLKTEIGTFYREQNGDLYRWKDTSNSIVPFLYSYLEDQYNKTKVTIR
jgi:hypothetical protein